MSNAVNSILLQGILAERHFTGEGMPDVDNAPGRPVTHLAVTWLLMFPLLFYACRGILWFQAIQGNNAASVGFSSMAAAPKTGVTMAVLLLVLTIVGAVLLTRTAAILAMCWGNKVFLLLAVYALASSIWSQSPIQSVQFGIYIVLNVLLVFYLHARFLPRQVMRLMALVGWIIVVSSIFFAVALPQYGVDHRPSTSGDWQGVFLYKNTCSVMVSFLLSVMFYIPVVSSREKCLRTAYIMLSIFLILMTRARTGWLVMATLLAYVGVMKLVTSFQIKDRLPLMCLVLLVALLFTTFGMLYYSEIFLLLGKDSTLTGRTDIWKLIMISAGKRPLLGYGYRAFWNGIHGESANISLMERWSVPGSHNGFLEVWLDLGLVGLSLVLYTLVRAFYHGITCLKNAPTVTVMWYISVLVITVVSNMAEITLMFPNYLTWIMYMVACVGLAHEAKQIRLPDFA